MSHKAPEHFSPEENGNELEFLQQTLAKNHFKLSEVNQEKLLAYLDILAQWNKVFNLTAIQDRHDMIMLHILDSLSIYSYLHGNRLIDVGTGAGLPGLPLALMYPEKEFVLLDSNNKKTRFLTQVMIDLKIKNIEIVHSRCEDFQPMKKFDSVLTRAFSSIKVMLESTQHLLNEKGEFLAMKGIYPEKELQEIPADFKLLAVHALKIQGLDAERHLICLQKV